MKHPFCVGSLSICLFAAAALAQSNSADKVNSFGDGASPPAAAAAPKEAAPPPKVSPPVTPDAAATVAPVVIPENPPQPKSGKKSAEPAPPTPSGKASPAPYVIGSLDVLAIKVWNNANLTQLVDVRPDGMISLPLIGEVKADGLTVEQLKQVLTSKLDDYLTDPQIDIQVTRINSKRYFILGEGAVRPGAFPLTEPMTVMEALSNAGGFRDFANVKKIYVLRGTQRFPFNYKEVSQGKHLEQDIPIQNGDRIIVPQ